ncbi:MAG: ABC transporter substrate-binding protein [Caldilineaceae bacterium]
MHRRIWITLLIVTGLFLAACAPAMPASQSAEGESSGGGELVVGLDQEPPTMDPHASPSAITFYVTASTGESLLYLDQNRELKPWLAESWEVGDEGRSFTFHLRNDVTFQDGTPFNAEAVKWNFDRIVDPNFKAGGALSALAGYQGTEVVDEFTAKVTFDEAFAPFLTYAAGGTLAMISPTATQAQGDDVNLTPVMSGPYKITEYVAKDHVTIERWADYNRTPPWSENAGPGSLDRVIWKFIPEAGTRVATLESGETQMATVIPAQDLPRLQESSEFNVMSVPWVGAPRIWLLNTTLAPTDNLQVRQAINYAIDRDAIVNTLYKGTGARAIGPLTAIMLDDPSLQAYYPYDAEKAAQLLEEAGWSVMGDDGIRQNANGDRLTLVINSIDYGAGPFEIDQLVQGQLRAVGIDASLKAQARPPWYEDNYNCATNGPIMFLRSGDWDGLWVLFHSSLVGGNFNWSCIADPDIDALLLQGRVEGDPTARKAIYLELEQKIMDMALSAPLVDEFAVWAMQANVTGLKFNGFTYPIITDVQIGQ